MRHRWDVNERGTGKCVRCKTRVKYVTRPKKRGTGKVRERLYTWPDGDQRAFPPAYCEAAP